MRLRTWAGLAPPHSRAPLMERIVSPKPGPPAMASCGVIPPGPVWVFQYQRPTFQATAELVSTSAGLFSRSRPRSPAAL